MCVGQEISIVGRPFTNRVADTQDLDDESYDVTIDRIIVGGQLCDPEDSNDIP